MGFSWVKAGGEGNDRMRYLLYNIVLFSAEQPSESAICIHIPSLLDLLSLPNPPFWVITERGADFPVLYSHFPLAIYFRYVSVVSVYVSSILMSIYFRHVSIYIYIFILFIIFIFINIYIIFIYIIYVSIIYVFILFMSVLFSWVFIFDTWVYMSVLFSQFVSPSPSFPVSTCPSNNIFLNSNMHTGAREGLETTESTSRKCKHVSWIQFSQFPGHSER